MTSTDLQDEAGKPEQKGYVSVMEMLMRYDVDPEIARRASMNHLLGIPHDRIREAFERVSRQERAFCPLNDPIAFIRRRLLPGRKPNVTASKYNMLLDRHSENKYLSKICPRAFDPPDAWISAPKNLMRQAAAEGAALCVNDTGQFSIRKNGYLTVSHAWIEGLRRDDMQDGVSRSKIDLIFLALRRQCLDVEWIWTDVLAVPGSSTAETSLEDDKLKISTINNLAQIYSDADGVVILDSLTWQSESNDPHDLAILLRCGVWATRLWTFQELKLSKKAYIITSGNQGVIAPEWSSIMKLLENTENQDGGVFKRLGTWATDLFEKTRPGLTQLVGVCGARATGNDVDLARALFPLLGLKWKTGMTREQGMAIIYQDQRWEATRMLFTYGSPKMTIRPGWASSSLVGLTGEITDGFETESRGIRGSVAAAQVRAIDNRFKRVKDHVLNCKLLDSTVQITVSMDESEWTLGMIDTQVSNGKLYLIRPTTELENGKAFVGPFSRVGLLVAKADVAEKDGFECAVLCSVTIMNPGFLSMYEQQLLIREGSYSDHGRDFDNRMQYTWHKSNEKNIDLESDLKDGELAIHRAVRRNDLVAVRECIGKGDDPHLRESAELSSFDVAASRGYDDILLYLLSLDDASQSSARPDLRSAIFAAAKYNQPSSIKILVDHGVPVDCRNKGNYTALMTATYEGSNEAAETLLELGADPNVNGSGPYRETPLGLTCGRTPPKARRLLLAKLLLDAGANPNGQVQMFENEDTSAYTVKPSVIAPLTSAVQWSHIEVVQLLLERGADPDTSQSWLGWLPLKEAIRLNKGDVARLLLDSGARCNLELGQGWNILHVCARSPDHELVQRVFERLSRQEIVSMMLAELDDGRWKPAQIAAKNGTIIVMKLFREQTLAAFTELKIQEAQAIQARVAAESNAEAATPDIDA